MKEPKKVRVTLEVSYELNVSKTIELEEEDWKALRRELKKKRPDPRDICAVDDAVHALEWDIDLHDGDTDLQCLGVTASLAEDGA